MSNTETIIIVNIVFILLYILATNFIKHRWGERTEAGFATIFALAWFIIFLVTFTSDRDMSTWNWIVLASWALSLYLNGKKYIELS